MSARTNAAILFCTTLLAGILGCSSQNPRVATKLNQDAALTAALPFNPLQQKVITSWIDKQNSTMSTLYGNDIAVQYARTNSQHDYPTGSVLSLVIWNQQEDPRWFGGNIPAAPQSVEFVTVKAGQYQKPSFSYQQFEGTPLKQTAAVEGPAPNNRAAWLLAQRAAVMP